MTGAEEEPKKYGIVEEAPELGADDGAPVPKLPRGSGFTLSTPHLLRIGMIVVTLFALLALQKPCSNAVGRFVTTFGDEGSAGSAPQGAGQPAAATAPTAPSAASATAGSPTAPATPATVTGPDLSAPAGSPPIQYERLTPAMTDEELRAAIERAKRRAAAAEAPAGGAPEPATPRPAAPAGSGGQ